jgi:predicted nucleic acid-binding protein
LSPAPAGNAERRYIPWKNADRHSFPVKRKWNKLPGNLELQRLRLGYFRAAATTALALEYEDVLHRRNLITGYSPAEITGFIDSILHFADEVQVFFRWRPLLPDPGDDLVFECALAAGAAYIITFNTADFRGLPPLGISVVTPAQFLPLLPQL